LLRGEVEQKSFAILLLRQDAQGVGRRKALPFLHSLGVLEETPSIGHNDFDAIA